MNAAYYPVTECRGAWLHRYTRYGVTVLAIGGQIDACNADQIREHVHRYASAAAALVVDMTQVEFFAVQGLRNLMMLGERCRNAGVEWALVGSRSVHRLLRVADVDRALPIEHSTDAALQRIRVSATECSQSA
jgi:anti-anti-sigma factor